MSDNPTGLEFDDIERANNHILELRQDVEFFRRKWQAAEENLLNSRAHSHELAVQNRKIESEVCGVQMMLSERIRSQEGERDVKNRRVVVLLAMFRELDRRHDFTYAEMRGAIKLMEGYAQLIADTYALTDIPF